MRLQAKLAFAAVLAIGLSSTCPAQQAGFRDLTTFWRVPDDHVPLPSLNACPNVHSTVADGELVKPTLASAEKLQLTIAEIAPLKLRLGKDFTATVRLKNIGTDKILIPWQPDGEQIAHVSADGTEEKYEVADVSFRLAASGKKSIAVPLHSEGALFAQPDDPVSYLTIEPGHWADVKLRGTVACGLDNCRSDVQADDHAVLTAWWYQRVLTHQVKDCNEVHGAYTVRKVDSAPLPIVVRPAPAPSNSTRKQFVKNPNLASDTRPAGSRYSRSE